MSSTVFAVKLQLERETEQGPKPYDARHYVTVNDDEDVRDVVVASCKRTFGTGRIKGWSAVDYVPTADVPGFWPVRPHDDVAVSSVGDAQPTWSDVEWASAADYWEYDPASRTRSERYQKRNPLTGAFHGRYAWSLGGKSHRYDGVKRARRYINGVRVYGDDEIMD